MGLSIFEGESLLLGFECGLFLDGIRVGLKRI